MALANKDGEALGRLRSEVLAANLELVERGLVVIKPSGIPYAELRAEDLPVFTLDGTLVDGKLKPSSDLDTHLHLYREFVGIGAVVHTHSEYATAWAQAGRALPAYGTTHADYFHGPVPVTAPLSDAEIAEDYVLNTGVAIARLFARGGIDPLAVPTALVAGHAPFVWGRSPREAAHNAVVLEAVARKAYLTEMVNADAGPVSQALLDRHHSRKHGATKTYGQG